MTSPNSPWRTAVNLAGVALRSFAGTLLCFLVAGVLLAAGSWYFLRDEPLYGGMAAALALAEAAATGVFLGGKRALVMTCAHGFKTMGLGQSAMQMIFERLLGVSADQQF